MAETEPARVTMSLRQRHIKKGFRSGDAAAAGAVAGAAQGAALATVAVGLKPGEMTKLERQLFGSRMKDYLKSRCDCVSAWQQPHAPPSAYKPCTCSSTLGLGVGAATVSHVMSGCCRDKILVKWFEDCTHTVDLRQLLGEEPASRLAFMQQPVELTARVCSEYGGLVCVAKQGMHWCMHMHAMAHLDAASWL